MPDVGLDLAPQLGDETLSGFGKELGQGEGGDALDHGGGDDSQNQRKQQVGAALADDVVN